MYKTVDTSQSIFLNFDQPMGLHMNAKNRWIKMAEQLTENPYYQYFIGLPGYQEEAPIDAMMQVHWFCSAND